jgi:hypothetical protein
LDKLNCIGQAHLDNICTSKNQPKKEGLKVLVSLLDKNSVPQEGRFLVFFFPEYGSLETSI